MFANGATPQIMSLHETVKLFHENGVDLIDWDKGDDHQLPMIRFHGDETEGFKVVEIAQRLGLWPIDLHRVWYYRYGLEQEPKWNLHFCFPPAEGQFDDDQLELMVDSLSYEPLYRTSPLGSKQLVP